MNHMLYLSTIDAVPHSYGLNPVIIFISRYLYSNQIQDDELKLTYTKMDMVNCESDCGKKCTLTEN